MKKIGMALVGTGFLADVFARCYREMPDVDLVAVSSKSEGHAADFARKYGIKSWYANYEEMLKLDDIDAVNVTVPNYLHGPVSILAAERGKHVICTKPLATTMEQAEKMVSTAKRTDVILMYGENWLFHPATERMERIIKEGALGKVLAIEAREQHSGSHSPYATKKEFSGGGVLIHMAVHPIAFIIHMFNEPVKRVYAELGNLLHPLEVEDYAVLLMRFNSGASGVAQSNYITQGGMQDRMEIYGTEGMAFMNLTHVSPITVYSNVGYSYVVEKATMSSGWTSPTIDERIQYGFANMLRHFKQCIVEELEPISSGAFGRDVLKVVFAGYESNQKKMSITL